MSIDDKKLVDLSLDKGDVTVEIYDAEAVGTMASKTPRRFLKLSFLHSASKFLNLQGITFDVKDNRGTLIKIGRGASPLLGRVDAHVLRLREYIK
jgi:hypothetical protein